MQVFPAHFPIPWSRAPEGQDSKDCHHCLTIWQLSKQDKFKQYAEQRRLPLAPPRLPRGNGQALVRRVPPGLIGAVPRVTIHMMGQPLPPRAAVPAPAQDGVGEFRESVYLVREAEVILFERPDVASVGAQTGCHHPLSRLFRSRGVL